MVSGLGKENRQGAGAAPQVGDRLRGVGQQREEQSLPGGAGGWVAQPMIGRFVERFGFAVLSLVELDGRFCSNYLAVLF